MPIRNKRTHLAAALRATGALAALERIDRRPCLVVLAYHRIADPRSDPFYSPLISATPAQFRHTLGLLRHRYRFLELDQLADAIDENGRLDLSEPCALVTFDDGYRDNLTTALPILRELRLPAAIFLTTSFLDREIIPWWDRVAFVLKSSPVDTVTLESPKPLHLDLVSEGRESAIVRLVAAFIAAGWNPSPDALEHLHTRAEVPLSAVQGAARDLFLNWDDVRQLAQSGITLGAHTRTHRRLADLSPEDQYNELRESRRAIERALGRGVSSLAYPFGGRGAYDDATRRVAQQAGYTLAFSLRPAAVRLDGLDPLDVPRFNVVAVDTPTQVRARLLLARSIGRAVV
jgi:peptidoglycan/xylan/chitin deacetylase (PgdA/CDA1 family)